MLLRALQENAMDQRETFFNEVRACRRRLQKDWHATPIATVFTQSDEYRWGGAAAVVGWRTDAAGAASSSSVRSLRPCARSSATATCALRTPSARSTSTATARSTAANCALSVRSGARALLTGATRRRWGGLEWLGMNLQAEDIYAIVRHVDKSGEGRIRFADFDETFTDEDEEGVRSASVRHCVTGGRGWAAQNRVQQALVTTNTDFARADIKPKEIKELYVSEEKKVLRDTAAARHRCCAAHLTRSAGGAHDRGHPRDGAQQHQGQGADRGLVGGRVVLARHQRPQQGQVSEHRRAVPVPARPHAARSVWGPLIQSRMLVRRNRMRVCLGHYAAADFGKPGAFRVV
jgi:hypothetical protein